MVGVELVGQVLVLVAHVLAGVDVEVLLLIVLNFEWILLNELLILSQMGREQRSVELSLVSHKHVVGNVAHSAPGESLPANSHTLEAREPCAGLETEVHSDPG